MNNLLIVNIVNSGISLIMGFYMFFLYRNPVKFGTGYWASGSLIIGVGLLLKALLPVESSFNILGCPIFITIGLYIYLAGIWEFKEKKIRKWIIIGIPTLDLLQTIIFFTIFHSQKIQMGLHLIFLIIYCLLAINEMIRLNPSQNYLKSIFFLNAFSFFIFLVLLSLNLYILITNPNFDFSKTSNAAIIIQIISGFIMIALTFGFLSAVNIRLNMELEVQLKSKTKFLSIIGHDLRGPVGNIINFLDLLQNESDLNEKERKEYLKILNTLSQSTFHLLQNLLEWANNSKNLDKFEREGIELNQIIANDINFFKSSAALKSINIEFKDIQQAHISGSLNMIKTIVRNLVSNAIKFTPIGGTITITLEKVLQNVRLTISDTGQGIKPERINTLLNFENSKSTKGTNGETGSGLGLALCNELVRSNNGVINIESDVGQGTKVIVEFPSAIVADKH